MRFFRTPGLSASVLAGIMSRMPFLMGRLQTEICFYIEVTQALAEDELEKLKWLLRKTYEPRGLSLQSFLSGQKTVYEIGSRLNFETPFSSVAVGVCHACGLSKVTRTEQSIRLGLDAGLDFGQEAEFLTPLHDRMTQMVYKQPLESLDTGVIPLCVRIIPILEQGYQALEKINRELGLAMDESDLSYYCRLFAEELQRNSTDVELGQIGNGNSDHSRHNTFGGRYVIDGQLFEESLMDIIKKPWLGNPGNSVLAFEGNCSAIRGFETPLLVPAKPGEASCLIVAKRVRHLTKKAETHCHPTRIEPFQGSTTGTGGEIRDRWAAPYQGGIGIAGGAGYIVGNLHIPEYDLPWENDGWTHPPDGASPLEILIKASNGASDYGNCIGQPLVVGFARTLGMELPEGYHSYYKPVMLALGVGHVDDQHLSKPALEAGMLVVQIGGPAYRIGVGGGAASSLDAGQNATDLDFASVQRGDPEMEQRTNRFIRACVEMREGNPIVLIGDLGAGGDSNGLTELVFPAGARINLRAIPIGDRTLSTLEIWSNESQERYVLVIRAESLEMIAEICQREKVPYAVVGEISGDGRLQVADEDGSLPVDLPLDRILGELPRKVFTWDRVPQQRPAFELPSEISFREVLEQVLRLPSVCSKAFLTSKVDRSVTGLIAQQQCVGPNHVPVSDYAVVADSYFSLTGQVISIGEQPLKGLISPRAMVRLSIVEALLNMVGARITKFEDIKFCANWMWAARSPGEGAKLHDAVNALSEALIALGLAVDGGKDSLSMACRANGPDGKQAHVKSPGTLVLTATAPMPDITFKVTPEFKKPGNALFLVDLGGKIRPGGSALAQVGKQVGDICPDADDLGLLKAVFEAVQVLIANRLVSSVHDRSDGGLIVTLLEMAFAGNLGFRVEQLSMVDAVPLFFNEELGLVLECEYPERVSGFLSRCQVPHRKIGSVSQDVGVQVVHNHEIILYDDLRRLRTVWEATSTEINKLQTNPKCAVQEANQLCVKPSSMRLTFEPQGTAPAIIASQSKPLVAILREEGSNGDREMAAAFYCAGFDPWDITMTDLASGRVSLDNFPMLAAVGGFSYRDVFESAVGWAGVIRFNPKIRKQFDRFYERADTLSLGVCNGCQLLTLLGVVPGLEAGADENNPRFIGNESGRFESRFPIVEILPSPAVMLTGMEWSRLGIWIAHGEGRLHAKDKVLREIEQLGLAPLRFVDGAGATHVYPFNPNGSPGAIAALCSPDGRHLAMMPHPERLFLKWQWPWMPSDWQSLEASPWLRLFQNAYQWCIENR